MALFDFEEAERDLLKSSRRQTRGDTVKTLLDHRWLSMSILLMFVGAFAGNVTVVTLTGFMLVVVGVAWLWSRRSLRRVNYLRKFEYKRVFPGETFDVQVIVENRKLLPLGWLRVEDEWPLDVGPEDESRLSAGSLPELGHLSNTYTLRWYQRVRRRFKLLARHRGVYQVGPAFALSGDPFNLFERGSDAAHPEYLIVYPEVKSLPEIGLPMKDPLGDIASRQRLFEDPNRIMGVRDHRPEDDLRHVHWKATARAGDLQTRIYEPTRSVNVVYCLNVATYERHWHGFWPEMLEYLVSTAASLATWGTEQNHAVGLIANGTLAHADQPFRVLPSRNRDQLTRILETLAGVSYIVTQEFTDFLLDESPRMPFGATFVLVTAFVNDDLANVIIRLRDSGRHVVMIVLGKDAPPEIPGVLAHHLPIASEPPPPPDPDSDDLTPRQRFLLDREERLHAEQEASV